MSNVLFDGGSALEYIPLLCRDSEADSCRTNESMSNNIHTYTIMCAHISRSDRLTGGFTRDELVLRHQSDSRPSTEVRIVKLSKSHIPRSAA